MKSGPFGRPVARTCSVGRRRQTSSFSVTLIVIWAQLRRCQLAPTAPNWKLRQAQSSRPFFKRYKVICLRCSPDLHEGEHWTWCGPGADPVRHRLDFVVLPQGWRNLSQTSWIWYDFEALQARQDHMPACVHVTFRKASAPHAYTTAKRRAIRPARELSRKRRELHSSQPWSAVGLVHGGRT